MKPTFSEQPTYGELLGPLMKITDRAEAVEYFQGLVEYTMTRFGTSREEAESIQRSNIGYYAGYYGIEEQKRVQDLLGAVHPIFGPVGGPDEPQTAEEAFQMGVRIAQEKSTKRGGPTP